MGIIYSINRSHFDESEEIFRYPDIESLLIIPVEEVALPYYYELYQYIKIQTLVAFYIRFRLLPMSDFNGLCSFIHNVRKDRDRLKLTKSQTFLFANDENGIHTEINTSAKFHDNQNPTSNTDNLLLMLVWKLFEVESM